MSARADHLIASLKLQAHPEGGWFRRVYALALRAEQTRPALSAIHYLLRVGHHSRWHRVDADEAWTHHEGGAVEIFEFDPARDEVKRHVLGALDGGDDARPLVVVAADHWQAARPLGEYALMSCAVAPGFEYAGFALLDQAPAIAARLARLRPDLIGLG